MKNKMICIFVCVLLFMVAIVPIINADFIKKTNTKDEREDNEDVEIKINYFNNDGKPLEDKIIVSRDKLIKIIKNFYEIQKINGSLCEKFDMELNLLKENKIVSQDLTIESLIDIESINADKIEKLAKIGKLARGNNFINLQIGSLMFFSGIGKVIDFGKHDENIYTQDNLNIVYGIILIASGSLYEFVEEGSKNVTLFAALGGINVLYTGVIIEFSFGEVYGPMIIGIGYSAVSLWLGLLIGEISIEDLLPFLQ